MTIRSSGVALTRLGAVFPLVFGYTSGGSTNDVDVYADPNELKDDHGHGVGVELGLSAIETAGGVILCRPAHSSAGTAGSVTPTRIGSSVGTVTVSGAPYLAYKVKIEITETTSALGSGKFRYSLDAGNSWSGEKTIPSGGTYAITGTGLTITFVLQTGTPDFEDGDIHAFDCTAPLYSTNDLSSAVTALLDRLGTRRFRRAFFGGRSASASAAATMAAAISTHMSTFASYGYFARAVMDCGGDTVSNTQANFIASFSSDRVAACYGECDLAMRDTVEGWGTGRVPFMYPAAERLMATQLSENGGRKASGALRGVSAIRASDGSWGYDQEIDGDFTEFDRLIVGTHYRGEAGFYMANSFLKSSSASDFVYVDWGNTIDAIAEIVQGEQGKWLLQKRRVVPDGSGRLNPADASSLETQVRRALTQALLEPQNVDGFKGHVSALEYNIDRTNDFLTEREINSTFGAVPLPPIEGINTTGGFVRSVA
jgi:hypothetical protein